MQQRYRRRRCELVAEPRPEQDGVQRLLLGIFIGVGSRPRHRAHPSLSGTLCTLRLHMSPVKQLMQQLESTFPSKEAWQGHSLPPFFTEPQRK